MKFCKFGSRALFSSASELGRASPWGDDAAVHYIYVDQPRSRVAIPRERPSVSRVLKCVGKSGWLE